ncbi:hypothetical protein EXS61_02380 [Candidatus Parcubacteria bacterium]|nr:hypothetical protein [Candidatus Parcubacteria bacterium]
MKPLTLNKRAIYFYSFSLFFIIVIPFIIIYSLGYRFTKDYSLSERGGIYVYVPESGTDIYINDEFKKTTGIFQHELFLQNLKPGQSTVSVSSLLFQPWQKIILIKEKEVSPVFPFLVPKDLGLREIVVATSTGALTSTSTSLAINVSEQKVILALFKEPAIVVQKQIKPATTTPEIFAITKKKIKIWSDGNKVFAKYIGEEDRTPPYFCLKTVCDPILEIFNAKSPVRHMDFYPSRDDAIIVSAGDTMSALEIDVRLPQNIFTLYKGKKPDFRISGNKVYVKDGDFVGQISEI